MTDLDPALAAVETEIEQPAVVVEPEAGGETITAPDPAPAEAATDSPKPSDPPFWTREELRKSQKANKRLQSEYDRAQQELEDLRAQRRQPAAETPNYEDDPQGAYIRQAEQVQLNARLDTSELLARDRHGDEAVDELLEFLGTRPDLARWAVSQRNPYGAAMQAYRKEQLAAEIGDDPAAYRAKIEAELQARIRAEVEAQYAPNPLATAGQQAPAARIPTPASQQPSARPKAGQFAGPVPLSELGKHKF